MTDDYSGESVENDYLTLEGIELRTSIKRANLISALVGEIVDNGNDYQETHNVKNPYVHITVSKEKIKVEPSPYPVTFLRISIRNPVIPNIEHVFSKELLERIYRFGEYFGSKRLFKIHRGKLGDASKLMLGAPYALADSMNIDISNDATGIVPITLKTSTQNILKTFYIALRSIDTKEKSIVENEGEHCEENYTEVQILLPYDGNKDDSIENGIFNFLRHYVFLNTHIGFTFSFPTLENSPIFNCPATQPMIKSENLSSIHCYELHEFRNMVKKLSDKEKTFYDMFQGNFKSANNLPKNNLTTMSLGELTNSNEKIEEIFELRDKIPPVSEDENRGIKTMMPFKTSKTIRKVAIKNRLAQMAISSDSIKYKQKYDYYKSSNGVKYPYFFEVFVGHSKANLPDNLVLVQSINSRISNDPMIFGGGYKFNYSEDEGRILYRPANSIQEILEYYKYSNDDKKCKKPNSIVLINLISQRIPYESHGKSKIDNSPFAEVIADTIEKACKGGNDRDGRKYKIEALREVLRKRKQEYLAIQDPIERKKREWTQSDVFYAARKILVNEYGYKDDEIDREDLTNKIREECAKLGVTREQIGIVAADRAQLYFNKRWHDVGLDELDTLVEYGTDMLIIEKEGTIIQISSYSNSKRIALLNTRGFAVEYAAKLAKLASEKGCNISIMVDWDVSGLLIFLKLRKVIPNIKRIGVDFKTIADLGLKVKNVEENYTPNKNHKKPLIKILNDSLKDARKNKDFDKIVEYTYLINNLKYLGRDGKGKRIEINSITAELKDNARFWGWTEDQIRNTFPDRIFTRSFGVPEYVQPSILEELEDLIKPVGENVLAPHVESLRNKLSNNEIKNAFLFDRTNKVIPDYNSDRYDLAVIEQSRNIIENNDVLKEDLEDIEEVVNRIKARRREKTNKIGWNGGAQ